MKNKLNFALFIAFLGIFCFSIGFKKYYKLPPSSYHQGAQADRLSIVYNYWQDNTDFFHPKVMENWLSDGIVGCEFPILYYGIAQIFKVSGFSYDIYRIIFFCFFILGALSAYQIAAFYVKENSAAIITLVWIGSPIFCYYALNFLPDMPALGLTMFGWRLLLKQRKSHSKQALGLLILCLAGLLKASYSIHVAVAFSIYVLENRKIQWQILLVSIIAIGSLAAWYEWASYLNKTYLNSHFLLKPNPAISFPNFVMLIGSNWRNWQSEMYPIATLLVILIGIIFIFYKPMEQRLLRMIAMRLAILGLIYYLLFQTQFLYHDYYLLAFYPANFFFLLIAFIGLKRYFYLVGFLKFVFIILLVFNFTNAKEQFNARYDINSYYYQPGMPKIIEKYETIAPFINKYIPKDSFVITAFDNTPNTTLLFMQRRGIRISKDYSTAVFAERIMERNTNFVLCNDKEEFDIKLKEINGPSYQLIDSFKKIYLLRFKSKY